MSRSTESSTIVFLDKYICNDLENGEPKVDRLHIYSVNSKHLLHIYDLNFLECSDNNIELEYEVYAKKKDELTLETCQTVLESKTCKFCIELKGNTFFTLNKCEHFGTKQDKSIHGSEESILDSQESVPDSEDNTEDHLVTVTDKYNSRAEWDYIYQEKVNKDVIDITNKEKIIIPESKENKVYDLENVKKFNTEHEFKIWGNEMDQYISEPISEEEDYYSIDSSFEERTLCNSGDKADDEIFELSTECIISDEELKDTRQLNFSNVIKIECGYFIANKLMLSDYNWHTIVVNQQKALCAVCNEKFNAALIPRHVQTDKHKRFLSSYPPLNKYGYSITREIGSVLHCGICNKLYSKNIMRTHISEQFHKESLQSAMEMVSSYRKCWNNDNLYIILIFPKLEVKLPLENWNMVHSGHISFYCLPCKETHPAVTMMEHFNEKRHRENLSRCRLLSQHKEHTLRVIDSVFHHCGACNLSILKMQSEEHISSLQHLEAIERYSVLIEDMPRWRPIEIAALTVFETIVYVNKYDLHTIIYQTSNVLCALCNVILKDNEVIMHLNYPYHTAKMKRIPFLPIYGLNLIRLINMNTLHCCVCNVLVPNLIGNLRQHMYSVRHLLFKTKMLNPYAAINPTLNDITKKNIIKTEDVGHEYSNPVQSKEDKNVEIVKEKTVGNIEKCLNSTTDANMKTEKNLSSSDVQTIRNREIQGEVQCNNPEINLKRAVCKSGDKFVETDTTVEKFKENEIPDDIGLNSKSNLMNNEVEQIIEIKKDDVTIKKDDVTVEGSSERKPSKYYVNVEESKSDVTNGDKLGKENTEIEIIGKRLDDFENLYSTSETDSQEFINLKFDEIYLKILRISWDGIINYFEKLHCLICEVDLVDDTMRHVNGSTHQENIMKKGFLRKYGENLIRQFDKVHHCAVCNLIVHKSVDNHIDWGVHRENLLLSKDTNKELKNAAEFKTSMVAEGKLILERFKPITVNVVGYTLAVKWANWHSILPTKNGFTCILCQSEIMIDKLKEHVHNEKHNNYVLYPVKCEINLIRDIDEYAVHCVICNKRLTRNASIDVHINGAKHKKNLNITKIKNDFI